MNVELAGGFTLLIGMVKRPWTFCFHDYGKWEDVESGEIMKKTIALDRERRIAHEGEFEVVGLTTVQERRCAKCNKLKRRIVCARIPE